MVGWGKVGLVRWPRRRNSVAGVPLTVIIVFLRRGCYNLIVVVECAPFTLVVRVSMWELRRA